MKQIAHKLGMLAAGMSVIFALTLPVLAQQTRVFQDGNSWVREISGELSAAKSLTVKVDVGAVHVIGGSQSSITYTVRSRAMTSSEDKARKSFATYRIASSSHGDTALITADEDGSHRHCSDEFWIKVPQQLRMARVNTEGGEIEVKSLDGHVEAESGGGAVTLDGIGGTVHASTGGGDITVGSIAGDAYLDTGGGAIRVRSVQGKLEVSTGGGSVLVENGGPWVKADAGAGSIVIRKSTGSVHCETGSGTIDLGEIPGEAYMETGSGSLHLNGAYGKVHAETGSGTLALYRVGSGIQAETGSGGITAEFVSGSGLTQSSLETGSGDIIVYISPLLRATLLASIEGSSGHTIHSEFAEFLVHSEGTQWEHQTVTAAGNLNGGGPQIHLVTANGNIQIRKANR